MQKNAFTLDSLLEIHDSPFVIINAELTVVGVNQAWEQRFGITREQIAGQPCCPDTSHCRHRQLFEKLEPYTGLCTNPLGLREHAPLKVRAYPLIDTSGQVYIGELLTGMPVSAQRAFEKNISMVGSSPTFGQFKARLEKAADTLAPVLICGETGTGKELAAEFIHQHSKAASGEFVIVDCTMLTDELFESELFGHEKGAFTGAGASKKGLFELADKGTLFLDEIGELPLPQQPKLLRALESGQFRRVGGTVTLKSNVRVVSASHRNLAEMVKAGRFREDLFYRLSVFPLQMPPLRARKEDIPALAEYLLVQIALKEGVHFRLGQSALKKLMQHHWPGNIRELRNCLHLAVGLCQGTVLAEADIQFQPQAADEPEKLNAASDKIPAMDYENPLDRIEAEFIAGLIAKHNGNRKQIAAEMNLSERTLYRKLSRLNLN
ncbi:MAG: Fis family transcriptional regulator [Methylobacter sp.]|nr:MAG: Fis family transcriptional regulator [Methylobacter sp.]PPD24518.1 MAG: Fis family transcriptional regulator [Methylobacter sp.]